MGEKMICVGALTRPHGIKGEFCLDLYADSPDVLQAPLVLEHGPRRMPVKVTAARPNRNLWLVKLNCVADRTQAEALAGSKLWIDRKDLPEPDENEAYVDELIGCPVELADGTPVGTLHHIEEPLGQLLLAIRDEDFEYLLPAHQEFLLELGEVIVIDPPAGLLEACRSPLPSRN